MYRGMREAVSDTIVVASSACLARVIRGSFCIPVRPINAVNVLRLRSDGGATLWNPESHQAFAWVSRSEKRARRFVRIFAENIGGDLA